MGNSCQIEGRVTLDGNPVANAIIVLSRVDRRDGFFCLTGPDGNYSANVRPGVFKVSVAKGRRVARVSYQGEEGRGEMNIQKSRKIDFTFVRRP